ncbi:hypothetical protein SKAU_G00420090 [Synaphobranchus kaupii]|uniref:Uncharacterized protein n=1 Tax=Synaphobranchus kaupii TaxID=118154 RepID=A0A9Q1E6F6_SYNKA|nr:hypothetical protein SKAU_G00420090 [Synaphobranchus kaupii]
MGGFCCHQRSPIASLDPGVTTEQPSGERGTEDKEKRGVGTKSDSDVSVYRGDLLIGERYGGSFHPQFLRVSYDPGSPPTQGHGGSAVKSPP